MSNQNPVSIIVVGCGSRGEVYSSYALKHPDRAQIIGIADPRIHIRKKFQSIYNSSLKYVFNDWQEFVNLNEKISDCVIITLPDKLHQEASVKFTKLGYHILLEKPMATLLDECKEITMASRSAPEQINAVCHVLRYLGPCIKIKHLIDSGLIGDVVNISHTEPVGYWHFAHSFVRGNWRSETHSSFSLLAKCCHDIDLLIYWMSHKKCTRVSSFGSLFHFKPQNASKNSTNNCFTCPNEPDCCYSAKKLYLNPSYDVSSWPSSVVLSSEIQNVNSTMTEADIEDLFVSKSQQEKKDLLEKCLRDSNTNYGRCVYKHENDVCDNQVVNIEFEDGSTANLTMIAFTKDICSRKTKVYGTRGMLEWDDATNLNKLIHNDFLTDTTNIIDCSNSLPIIEKNTSTVNWTNENIKLGGHGGSDYYLMDSFVEAVLKNDKSYVLTDLEDSFRSHLIVFAAEHSRLNNKVVDINEYCLENNIQI